MPGLLQRPQMAGVGLRAAGEVAELTIMGEESGMDPPGVVTGDVQPAAVAAEDGELNGVDPVVDEHRMLQPSWGGEPRVKPDLAVGGRGERRGREA